MKTATTPEAKSALVNGAVQSISIERLEPNPNQPRQTWTNVQDDVGQSGLQRLAASIREQGILQPLVVTPHNGKFQIVCGERRFRAAKDHTELKALPCIVRTDLDERKGLEVSLTENLQREDLTPMDAARSYDLLLKKCGYSAGALAKRLGLSPAAISQKLALLKLTPELQADVHAGRLSETQGTVIAQSVSHQSPEQRPATFREIKARVDQARGKKSKLDTKDVRTIARTAAAKKQRIKIVPLTPREKKDARSFFQALDRTRATFRGIEGLLTKAPARHRYAEGLYLQHKDAGHRIQDSVAVLCKLFDELQSVEREQTLA